MKRISLLALALIVVFASCNKTDPKEPEKKLPNAVDLGLSVLWGDANVGASTVTERGSLFQWAGIKPSVDCKAEDAPYWDPATKSYTKYNREKMPTIQPEDDAATQNLKDGWRMPTLKEMDELREKCSFEAAYFDGKKVIKVTGPNGKIIYLPISGHRMDGTDFQVTSSFFWTNSINIGDGNPEGGNDKMGIGFYGEPGDGPSTEVFLGTAFCYREVGMPIRPVKNK